MADACNQTGPSLSAQEGAAADADDVQAEGAFGDYDAGELAPSCCCFQVDACGVYFNSIRLSLERSKSCGVYCHTCCLQAVITMLRMCMVSASSLSLVWTQQTSQIVQRQPRSASRERQPRTLAAVFATS
jgi:hypothetical protein